MARPRSRAERARLTSPAERAPWSAEVAFAGALPRRFLVDDLAKLRMLADPMRARVIETLQRGPATAKQIAAALGEPPSRLYHHVTSLEKAGLIQLVGTRRVRGAIERYFRPVAQQYVVDRQLFAPARGGRRGAAALAVANLTADFLDSTAREVREGIAAGTLPLEDAHRVEVARLTINTTDKRVLALMKRLRTLIAEAGRANEVPGAAAYRLTVAFYPVED